MWAGFKAHLRSLRRDVAEAEDRHHQALLERKAKRAAKAISKDAHRELLDWEQRHGYRREASKTGLPFRAHTATSSRTVCEPCQPPFHRRSISGVKIMSDADNQRSGADSNPPTQVGVTPSNRKGLSSAPTLDLKTPERVSRSFADEFVDLIQKGQDTDPEHDAPAPRSISVMEVRDSDAELKDKEALLKEIQTIRAKIRVLRTGAPSLSVKTANLKNDSGSGPLDSSKAMTGSANPRQAPWLTADRSPRPGSMTSPGTLRNESQSSFTSPSTSTGHARQSRRKSVADIFAEDSPGYGASSPNLLVSASNSSPLDPPRLSLDGLPALTVEKNASVPLRDHRVRAKSSSSVSRKSPTFRAFQIPEENATPLSAKDTEIASNNRFSRVVNEMADQSVARPKTSQTYRHIVDGPEEARKRLSAAMGRNSLSQSRQPIKTHRKQPKRRFTNGGEVSPGGLTVAELQSRHQAKLRELQGPANAKVAEAHAFAEAKAEWERKLLAEKKEQDRKMRERGKLIAGLKDSSKFEQLKSFRRRTKSADMFSQTSDRRLSSNVRQPSTQAGQSEDVSSVMMVQSGTRSSKRLDGAQRASEWRRSLIHVPYSEQKCDALSSREVQPTAEVAPAPTPSPQNTNQDSSDTPSGARAQSSLGMPRPKDYTSRSSEQITRLHQIGPRPQSLLISASQTAQFGQMRQSSQVPASRSTRGQMTATDLRRIREGAGRVSSPSAGPQFEFSPFHHSDPMAMPAQPRSLQPLTT